MLAADQEHRVCPPKLNGYDRKRLTPVYRVYYPIKSHTFISRGLDMANTGYARVSTNGQDLALQQAALKAAGCEKVYAEKISGARSDRPQLARMLKALAPGDTIVVTRLDRLARSTLDLLHTVDLITKAGAGFRSLADAWADTTTPHGRTIHRGHVQIGSS